MTIRIDGTNTAANPGITGSDTDTGLQFGTDEVNIVTGGTSRVTVDSNGQVGIGTNTVDLSQFGSNTRGLSVKDLGATNTGIQLSDGNYHNYLVQAGNSNLYLAHYGDSGDIVFGTGSSGNERARLLYSGGLTFNGDTAAANALDDYEEGTWTPAIASGGWTLASTLSAKYVKIGRQVTVQCYITLSGSGNSSAFQVSGLPFNPASDGYSTGVADFNKPGKSGIYVRATPGSDTVAYLYSNNSPATQRSELNGGQIGDGYHIFTLTYQV